MWECLPLGQSYFYYYIIILIYPESYWPFTFWPSIFPWHLLLLLSTEIFLMCVTAFFVTSCRLSTGLELCVGYVLDGSSFSLLAVLTLASALPLDLTWLLGEDDVTTRTWTAIFLEILWTLSTSLASMSDTLKVSWVVSMYRWVVHPQQVYSGACCRWLPF